MFINNKKARIGNIPTTVVDSSLFLEISEKREPELPIVLIINNRLIFFVWPDLSHIVVVYLLLTFKSRFTLWMIVTIHITDQLCLLLNSYKVMNS